METFTLLTVTLSNVFGIIPLITMIQYQRYHGAMLTTIAILASTLMNATETRHKLPGLFLAKYSKNIRNIERTIARITGLYGIYLFYTNPFKTPLQICLPLVGGIALFGSDYVNKLSTYTFFQVFWHASIYITLYLIIH